MPIPSNFLERSDRPVLPDRRSADKGTLLAVAPGRDHLRQIDIRRNQADMAVTVQYTQGPMWHARDHELRLLNRRHEVILLRREKERWRLQIGKPIPDVVRHEELQPVDIAFTIGRGGQLHETSNLLAARVRRVKPKGCRTANRSEEHTSELQSLRHLVCRLLLEKKKR